MKDKIKTKIRRCIACGEYKEITEFFFEYVCMLCFPTYDKYGRNRKVMKDHLEKERKNSI